MRALQNTCHDDLFYSAMEKIDSQPSHKRIKANIFAITKSKEIKVKVKSTDASVVVMITVGYLLDYLSRLLEGIKYFDEEAKKQRYRNEFKITPLFLMLLDLVEHTLESPCDVVECRYSSNDWESGAGSSYYFRNECFWTEDDFAALATSFERNTFRHRMKSYSKFFETQQLKAIQTVDGFYKTNLIVPGAVAYCELLRIREKCING